MRVPASIVSYLQSAYFISFLHTDINYAASQMKRRSWLLHTGLLCIKDECQQPVPSLLAEWNGSQRPLTAFARGAPSDLIFYARLSANFAVSQVAKRSTAPTVAASSLPLAGASDAAKAWFVLLILPRQCTYTDQLRVF